ncbi:MAG: YgdI/YgdR family lipoprotein [Saccharofermentans sp.]|nr:YgdI/YgdR family lipoprotein [Saccharofermentans sp.]
MKKIISVVLLLVMALSFAACGSSYLIEGEKDAIKSYKCTNKNMLGLNKIVIFEDRVVAVFDKAAPKSDHAFDIQSIINGQLLNASAVLTGTSDYQSTSKYEVNGEVFVITIYLTNNGDTKVVKPEQGRDISKIVLNNYSVTMNGGYLKISHNVDNKIFVQSYSPVTTSWSGIKEQAATPAS